MTSPDPSAGKPAIRRLLRERLRTVADPAGQSAAIRRLLAGWIAGQPPAAAASATIATFAALAGEPVLDELIADPALTGWRWCLPRIDADQLVFAAVDGADGLRPGAFGVREPGPAAAEVSAGEIGLVLCPGLGFTAAGHRIGRGKGYYDRFLAGLDPSCPRVGIAFREQLLDALPVEPFDQPMSHLATADGIRPVG